MFVGTDAHEGFVLIILGTIRGWLSAKNVPKTKAPCPAWRTFARHGHRGVTSSFLPYCITEVQCTDCICNDACGLLVSYSALCAFCVLILTHYEHGHSHSITNDIMWWSQLCSRSRVPLLFTVHLQYILREQAISSLRTRRWSGVRQVEAAQQPDRTGLGLRVDSESAIVPSFGSETQ